MGAICTIVATILFFVEASGIAQVHRALAWGLFFLALGMVLGGAPALAFWKKRN